MPNDHNTYAETVRRILALAGEAGISPRKLSLRIGKKEGYVGDLRRGIDNPNKKGYPKIDALAEIARVFDVSIDYLRGLTPERGRFAGAPLAARSERTVTFQGDTYAAVPRYDIQAGAGPGAELPGSPAVKDRVLFRLEWLQRATSAPADKLAALDVVGDSMMPTLGDGDIVLMDLTQIDPQLREGIYVINDDGRLRIKRLEAAGGRLAVISDNHAYPRVELARGDVDVQGRVIWMGRQL